MEIHKKEGENNTSLYSRFRSKIKRSGVLTEARKRRYHDRPLNERKRRLSALYRIKRVEEVRKAKKLGTF